jgi:hypothetical protein
VAAHEAPEHTCSSFDQVGGRIVGLRQFVEARLEKLERLLGERIDEALLRAEQAVDRACRGAGTTAACRQRSSS